MHGTSQKHTLKILCDSVYSVFSVYYINHEIAARFEIKNGTLNTQNARNFTETYIENSV